ncbi:hypothetical protein IAU59_005162 [Kwoniella sp. CBS 9459]
MPVTRSHTKAKLGDPRPYPKKEQAESQLSSSLAEPSSSLFSSSKVLKGSSKVSKGKGKTLANAGYKFQLPNEILERIVTHLSGDHTTLHAWCLASRNFYQLGWKLHWRHLTVTKWTTAGGESSLFINTLKDPVIDPSIWSLTQNDARTRMLREQVKIFSVLVTGPCWCYNDGSRLPNLKTLRLRSSPRLRIGTSFGTMPYHLGYPYQAYLGIRPHTLVIEHLATFDRPGRALFGHCSNTISGVHTVIFLSPVERTSAKETFERASPVRLKYYFPSLKRVIWIHRTAHGRVKQLLSLAKASEFVPITAINLRSRWTGSLVEEAKRPMRNTKRDLLRLGQELKGAGWSDAERDKRLASIKFTTFKEFLDNEEWWDVFEPEEVERWMRLSR